MTGFDKWLPYILGVVIGGPLLLLAGFIGVNVLLLNIDLTEPTISTFGEQEYVYYDGDITGDGVIKVIEKLNKSPYDKLVIRSRGGAALSGDTLAEYVYKNNISLYINSYCISACTVAAAVAPTLGQITGQHNLLGFHGSSYSVGGGFMSNLTAEIDEETNQILRDANVDADVIEIMHMVPGNQLVFMTVDEFADLRDNTINLNEAEYTITSLDNDETIEYLSKFDITL